MVEILYHIQTRVNLHGDTVDLMMLSDSGATCGVWAVGSGGGVNKVRYELHTPLTNTTPTTGVVLVQFTAFSIGSGSLN